MSKQPSQHDEPSEDDKPTRPMDAVDDPTVPLKQPAEPVAKPHRQRRRVDPEGETLHTGSTARKPSIEEIIQSPSPTAAGTQQPRVVTPPPNTLATEPLEDSFEDEAAARARARDRAVLGPPVLSVVLQVVLAILAPIVILIAVIRLIASPLFLWFEYHRPGFPPDEFGMGTEERLKLGSYGLDYLFNLAPPAYLGDLRFANGNPVFTEAEVSHMVDVKQVMFATTIAGIIAAILCLICIILLYRMRKGAIARSLFAGAVWFTAAMIILAVVAALGWEAFFAGFHQLFFADGTWTFFTTDSLIRLYPGQFWVDAAIWIAAITLVTMIVIMIVTAPTARRRDRNAQAQRFMEAQVMGEAKPNQPGTTQPGAVQPRPSQP